MNRTGATMATDASSYKPAVNGWSDDNGGDDFNFVADVPVGQSHEEFTLGGPTSVTASFEE